MNNRYWNNLLILLIFLTPLYGNAQEPTKDERMTKGLIQVLSAFTIKRGLDEDSRCKHKSYREFTIDEIISSIPQSEFKDVTDRLKMVDSLSQLRASIETKLPDGTPMYKQAYDNMIAAYRKGGVIASGTDAHCDVMNQAASNILQNAKNNFRLSN